MPHKHKRRQHDPNTYDLPPTLIAKPLPVRDPNLKPGKGKPAKSKPKAGDKKDGGKSVKALGAARRKSALDDDTPRAFRRLMDFQIRSQGLLSGNKKRKRDGGDGSDSDSGGEGTTTTISSTSVQKNKTKKDKKRDKKQDKSAAETTTTNPEEKATATSTMPKILPGEKLSDFAARVDREMPISGMKRSNKPAATDLPKIREHRVTKHEKRLRRLQAQWREDEARIREREEEEQEQREEEMEEQIQLWKEWDTEAGKAKAKKKGAGARKKRKGGDGGGVEHDDGGDPWAQLKKKRAAVNPFDVAQEPPQLKKPREVFKVRSGAKVDVANVPASVGSLRRREELANERRNIVEEYRRLMAEKRQK